MAAFFRSAWLPILILALIGCWIALERSPEQTGNAVVLRWVINSQDRDVAFAEAIRNRFESEHPGIRIQFIKTNEGNKVEAMIAGGDAPDIVDVGFNQLHYYVTAGVLRDLSPFMTSADRAHLKDYFPITLKPFLSTINHQPSTPAVYGLPKGYVPFILFYNKSLFDKAGVPYPSDSWTWEDYRRAAIKLTHSTGGITDEFGASFAQWQDGYYCWIYQNGGRVLTLGAPTPNPGGAKASFDSPKVIQAVEFLRRLTRDDKVIPTDTNRPKQTGLGLFEAGKLAMNGPTGSFYIPTYRTYDKIDWDIASLPRGPSGRGTMVAPFAFGVTSQSRHPKEAWDLVKFLGGEEGQRILADSGLFVPALRNVALSKEFLDPTPDTRHPTPLPRNKYALVAMMDDRDGKIPWGILPPWSGDRWGDVNDEALNANLGTFLFGKPKPGQTAESICGTINQRANEILAEDRAAYQGSPMNWSLVAWIGTGFGFVLVILWIRTVIRSARRTPNARSEHAWGYLAISPWLFGFLALGIGPILFSILLSMTRYKSLAPPGMARFVGFDHFRWILTGRDSLFLKSLWATGKYALLSVPIYLVAGLLIALLMNSRLRGITLFRTLYYLPAVMPIVASAALFGWIFRQQGILNFLIGGFGRVPFNLLPDWLGDPAWTIPAIVLMGLWGVGGGMMIYLAGLQNIPTQLYEAARIDGAGILAQFRAVTLPMLSPVIFFNLVMGIIGAFQVFSSAFVLFGGSSGGPDDSALFYSVYLYRKSFEQFEIGYGSALAWILFVIILAFTILVFRSSSFWVYYEGRRVDG